MKPNIINSNRTGPIDGISPVDPYISAGDNNDKIKIIDFFIVP
jgi:hypothetical protein